MTAPVCKDCWRRRNVRLSTALGAATLGIGILLWVNVSAWWNTPLMWLMATSIVSGITVLAIAIDQRFPPRRNRRVRVLSGNTHEVTLGFLDAELAHAVMTLSAAADYRGLSVQVERRKG